MYDPIRQRMLLFGGNTTNDVFQLTLTGTPTWSQLAPTGTPPSPRSKASVIYDPVRDRMLVVGSSTGPGSDVWALSLTGTPTWTQLLADGTIPGFFGGPAVYDSRRDRLVLLGTMEGTYLNAWALPLGAPPAWSVLAGGASTIPVRYEFAADYDSTNDRVLVYGGHGNTPEQRFGQLVSLSLGSGETWAYESRAGLAPFARQQFTFVRDPRRARFVMYGGQESLAFGNFNNWNSVSVWFLNDGSLLSVPPSPSPGSGLALASCRLVGSDRVSVRYTTADAGALSIEVMDIQGRRLGRGEATAAAAGAGEATVALSRAPAPGLAIVCVRQGAQMASKKLVMIR